MKTVANELPWKEAQESAACNFALGHLVANLPVRLRIDGRIHAETYISAVGAIAGYAAQRTLFGDTQPHNVQLATVASGDEFWFGDTLNDMLVPQTEAGLGRCVWSLAVGGAVGAGLQPERLPDLGAMFRHVASTIGGPNEGRASVAAEHQPQMAWRDLLKVVWPVATMCFSGRFPDARREYGAVPVEWWSAIAAQASSRPINDVKEVLAPDLALTLLMESAIYCSKLARSSVASS
jgi:hypothetical protein